jgi:hypothetical protein
MARPNKRWYCKVMNAVILLRVNVVVTVTWMWEHCQVANKHRLLWWTIKSMGASDMQQGAWTKLGAEWPCFQFSGKPGLNVDLGDCINLLEYFELCITPEITELISEEINRFPKQLLENAPYLKLRPRVNHWNYTNRDEIMELLAFFSLLGFYQKQIRAAFPGGKYWKYLYFGCCLLRECFTFYSHFFILLKWRFWLSHLQNVHITSNLARFGRLVLEIMLPFLNQGYSVTMHIWCSTSDLYDELFSKYTDTVGILCQDMETLSK